MKSVGSIVVVVLCLLGSSLLSIPPQEPDGEWRSYGGDAANSHYSRLTQINKDNVTQLRIAWEWKTGEAAMPQYGVAPAAFQASPLMMDDVLYLPTPYQRGVALNAETGKEIWNYDPHVYEMGNGLSGGGFLGWSKLRGVATWTDGKQQRIFLTSRGSLAALDAKTGEPVSQFGQEGIVDLTEHLIWKTKKIDYNNTSPPVVFKNLVIVGNSVSDGLVFPQSPPGDVQAFDTRTGKFVWSFHTIPQAGEFGNETWENDSWKVTGHANVWPPIALDEKRGLVYLPVTSPSNDYYGGERKGNTLFSDSLVCLDANTGKRVWHFQTVHHDLWDYDGVMGVNLLTIHVDGKAIDAVAAVDKNGFTYVFNRVTGEPVWPIVERPVPQSDVPGERTSPTQPFPTKPPAFAQQGFSLSDVIDFTPELKAMALEKIKPYRSGPLFGPPSLQGTLFLPSNAGGVNWGGGSIDPDNGMLYVRAENTLKVMKLEKQDDPPVDDPRGYSKFPFKPTSPSVLTVADGIPVNKPPYATLTAIDLNKGEIRWQVPVGDNPAIHNNPALKGINLPPVGAIGHQGSLVTAGGLIFIGPGDKKFYALDNATGKILWAGDLNIPAEGTPITYRTKSGKQFIVVATGSSASMSLVAFALP
jgi:quinoprotein glucose dehydrogenase